MSHRIFIDGEAGTTGQRLKILLAPFVKDGVLEILSIDEALRKDLSARLGLMERADLTVLCLPDEAALESAKAAPEGARILDASSAHRTAPEWIYGFPEMDEAQPARIAAARRVSNPGCYATGAISILRPLAGILNPDADIVISGISGYSGGGNGLIAAYESDGAQARANSWRAYGLHAPHKHVKEIATQAGLQKSPLFMPQTVDLFQGMSVSIVFRTPALGGRGAGDVHGLLKTAYDVPGSKVIVVPLEESQALKDLTMGRYASLDRDAGAVDEDLYLYVTGWGDGTSGEVRITAMLDNLGKGAASQAVQNMRLMLGF